MNFDNSLQLEEKEQGTLDSKDAVVICTKDGDADVTEANETDINTIHFDKSSDKNHSTTYEKLADKRPSEEKIYDKIEKRRMPKYMNFQLPAKKYVFSLIAVIGIVAVVLILVITLASQKNEDGNICEQPSEIQNGEAKSLTGLKQDDTFELNCKDGYRITGETRKVLNDTNVNDSLSSQFNDGQSVKRKQTINCTKNGHWSNIPSCEPVSCGKPIVPDHANVIHIQGISYQSVVVFSCRSGFEMVGTHFIVCQGNGTWSESPSCEKRVNGSFTPWASWGQCSKTCNEGTQWRYRNCTNPTPKYGGADCVGERSQGQTCTVVKCPRNGSFTEWSSWSRCSVSCGGGTQKRSRSCTNPSPKNGGKDCVGDSTESRACKTTTCPPIIDGSFTEWSSWSRCSVSCGGGTQKRSRSCTNPSPKNGGKDCVGDSTESRACKTTTCPPIIDGSFTEWSSWSRCSVSCGGGTQKRSRSCTNPSPKNGGKDCVGDSTESRACKTTTCPPIIDGGYSQWTSWGACSMSINKSVQARFRYCNSPPPSNGGAYCVGENWQVRDCNQRF